AICLSLSATCRQTFFLFCSGSWLVLLLPNPKQNRIFGGEEAKKGEFPHQVSIQIRVPILRGWRRICGGTILSENWILTAAHCNLFNVIGQSDARVVAGFLTLFEDDDEPTQQTAEIAEFIEHPYFHYGLPLSIQNDIALIHLATPLDLTAGPEVATAVLPSSDSDFPIFDAQARCNASGWGCPNPFSCLFGFPSNHLMWANITAFNDDKCREVYGSSYIPEQMLCAGTYDGAHGISPGDSGGPLLCEAPDGSMVVFGVSSFSNRFWSWFAFPQVWTEINHFLDWIRETAV
ncbi:unnamed protein product, partial [Cyprideis torosa]